MGRGNQYTHLVRALYCKLSAIGKQLLIFPQYGLGFELQTLEVGGKCVVTAPPWTPGI